MGRLQRIENKLERAINGAFAKAFRAEVQPVEIASAVRRAMDDGATSLVKGRTFAPTQYLVELSDTDFARLTAYEEDLREELVAAAEEHAESQRYQLKSAFGLRFGKDASLETGVFRIVTEDQPRAARRGEVTGADQRRGHHRSDQNPSGQPSARAAAGAAGGQPSARSGTESETASGGSSERDEARSDQHRSTQRREPDGMAQRREPDSTAQRREPDDWWYDGTQEPAVDRGMPGGPARAVPGGLPSGSPGLPGAARGADDVEPRTTRTAGARADAPPAPAGPTRAPAPANPPRMLAPADRPWLEIDGDRYPLIGPTTVLGRDIGAGIVVDDANVSRRHAEIRVTPDGPHLVARLKDLTSTNGTWVNGERITSVRLASDDRITIGQTTFTYHAGRR